MDLFNTLTGMRLHWIILCFMLLFMSLQAQQETQFWMTSYQLNSINPAVAGMGSGSQLIVHSNSQWTAIDDAPRTFAFSYATQTGKKLGVGINFVTDKVFVERQTQAFLDFSYPLQLSPELFLQLGLKAGGNFYTAATQNLRSTGQDFDPAQQSINTFKPNVGAGLYVNFRNFWLSLSQPRLLNNNLDNSEWVQSQDRIHTYAGLGATFEIAPAWALKPTLFMQNVKGLPAIISYQLAINFQEKIDFGLSHRSTGELGFMTYIPISSQITVGYAFAQPTQGNLAGLQLRTHEMLVKISLDSKNRVAFEKEEQ